MNSLIRPQPSNRIQLLQITKMCQEAPFSRLCGVVAVACISFLIVDFHKPAYSAIWSAPMLTLIFLNFLRTKNFSSKARSEQEIQRMGRYMCIDSVISGATWGLTSAFFFPMSEIIEAYLFIGIALILMIGTGRRSMYRPAMICFALPLSFVFFAGVLYKAHPGHYHNAPMFLFFCLIILLHYLTHNEVITHAMALHFEKEDLLVLLSSEKNIAERAKEQAERANLAKTRFLAAASHDIRQPMHALGMYISYLKQRNLDKRPISQELIDKIEQSAETVTELFNQLLTIAKLDAGAENCTMLHVGINDIFEKIRAQFAPFAASKQLSLRVHNSGYAIKTDPIHFERILANLVSNAIRYTKTGGILLGCRKTGEKINILVVDTGIGIDPREAPHIFEEYYQASNVERSREKGLGLGLSIVKRLTSLLGHTIEVRSTVGKGTVVSIEVTAALTDDNLQPTPPSVNGSLDGILVALVDNEEAVLDSTSLILRQFGCRVVTGRCGQELMQAMKEEASVDLVISDYRLANNETGIDVIKRVHQAHGSHIPSLLISGDTSPNELQRLNSAGFVLLHKPIRSNQLFDAMVSACQPLG